MRVVYQLTLIKDRRNQYRMIIGRQGMQRKRRTGQLSLGNCEVMELKLIKHDEALRELKS